MSDPFDARRARQRRLCLVALMVGAVGCTHGRRGSPESGGATAPRAEDYPGVLVRPDQVDRAFVIRQSLRVRVEVPGGAGPHEESFEVAVQLQGEELRLVGLAPWGGVAFVLTQRGETLEFDNRLPDGVTLPFPPRFVLQDFSRAFLFDAVVPWGTAGVGTEQAEVAGERVTERWADEALMERRFERLDGEPAGAIVVSYEGGMVAGRPPARVRLHNAWFGYTIEVTTLRYAPL